MFKKNYAKILNLSAKYINFFFFLSSLFGLLEWGGNNAQFLYEAEFEILKKLSINPGSVLHPLTIIPFLSQAILIYTLIQRTPSRTLTIIGIYGIGILMVLILAIGIMTVNIKMIVSTLPFILCAVVAFKHYKHLFS